MSTELLPQTVVPQLVQQHTESRVPITTGPRGVQLNTMEDMYRFAVCVSKSGLAPKGMEKPESILIAVEMGLEIGLKPMQALQNIAVINGRPSVWGDAMLGLCKQHSDFDHAAFQEVVAGAGDKMVATCKCRRLPDGAPVVTTFSVEDAKRANLWGKSGPWTQYPKRMLQMRARGFALRDCFPDVLRGLVTAEEAEDMPPARPVSRAERLMGFADTPALEVESAQEEDTPRPDETQEAAAESPDAPPAETSRQPGEDDEPDPAAARLAALEACKTVNEIDAFQKAVASEVEAGICSQDEQLLLINQGLAMKAKLGRGRRAAQ